MHDATNADALVTLSRRVDRLETQNHRLRRIVAVLVLIGGSFGVIAAGPKNDTLEAKRFDVLDDKGKPRARLGIEGNGEPHLVLYGKDAKARVVLSVLPEGGAGIGLVDDAGKRRLALDTLADGIPRLALYDRRENPRAALVVLPDGAGQLALYDAAGTPISAAPPH